MANKKINKNNISTANLKATTMFIDMNSFFASCEQQVNYWLRDRPVGVCVYTGFNGSVIALSKKAKEMGLKPAKLPELMRQCPEFVPLETNPNRYREFHKRIIKVLKSFSDDVIPFSIDEAVVNFASYQLVYKDMRQVAIDIKEKIKREVGDYLTCSIGIAPNEFLAKLGTELQKPDGLVIITPDNIDEVLSELSLTDLPGISKGMAGRLVMGGITSPLQLRHADPAHVRRACQSVVGEFWHFRLNFMEVDMRYDKAYRTMQAMRMISSEQRASTETLHDILYALCLQLEKRMMMQEVFCHSIGFSCSYKSGYYWSDHLRTGLPIQGGKDLYNIIVKRMKAVEETMHGEQILNTDTGRMMVWVADFVQDGLQQYSMFENSRRNDKLRKTVYNIRDKFGFEKIHSAAELLDKPVMKDVIGFGSIKDLSKGIYEEEEPPSSDFFYD
jgi:DNA polymerase-4